MPDPPLASLDACRLVLLMEAVGRIHGDLDEDGVANQAIMATVAVLDCEAASFVRLEKDEASRWLVIPGSAPVSPRSVPRDSGASGRVLRDGRPVVLDAGAAGLAEVDEDFEPGFVTRNLAAVAVSCGGSVVAALEARNHEGPGFGEAGLAVLECLARHVGLALSNGRRLAEKDAQLRAARDGQEDLIRKEKLAAMRQLSAGVAHEIRSPLTAISGYAQFVQRRLRDDPALVEKVVLMADLANQINAVVNGLLDFAQRIEADWVTGDANECLRQALKLCRPILDRYRRVKVVEDLPEGLPPVELDLRQLRQVFVHLITNAVQAMPSGGTLTLRSRHLPAEEPGAVAKVAVEVTDTGSGIPDEKRERVFQPFFSEGKRDAPGLGLAVSRSIIKSHRGAIEVESAEGAGSTFRVLLPVVSEP